MNRERLMTAGWVCLWGVVLTIPLEIVRGVLVSKVGLPLSLFSPFIVLATTGLSLYVWYELREMLNKTYHFASADNAILGMATLVLIWTAVNFFDFMVPQLRIGQHSSGVLLLFYVVTGVVRGVLGILLATELRRVEDAPQSLKTFGVLSMISGVMFCTVILIPLAALVSVVAKIVLIYVFWETSEFYKYAVSTTPTQRTMTR
ncbi:MAG: hypothetical protein K1Y02_14085 [Candidatus Hydrogenedentes bacterium]|nr:hypothetical protein [Candidatus Hydrogenedentota bacterium]